MSFRRLGDSLLRIVQLVRKEFWQYRSDMVMSLLLLILPMIQLFAVVSAQSNDGGAGRYIAVVDHDRTPASRQLTTALENSQEFRVQAYLSRLSTGDQALRQSEAASLLVIPPHFGRDLLSRHTPATLLALVDGTNLFTAGRLLRTIWGSFNRLAHTLSQAPGQGSVLALRSVKYFDVTSIQDSISSQLGFLLYQVVLLVAGTGIARERETGTLEQLLVTPLNRFELIAGKTGPALVVGIVEFFVLYFLGVHHYGVPMRGSFLLLFSIAVLFMLAQSAWGLLISSRVANQQQGAQTMFVQILVDMAFCGFLVPVDNLPTFLRWFSELLPLQHYLYCIRAIMLRGAGFSALSRQVGVLAVLTVAFWLIAVRALRKRLD